MSDDRQDEILDALANVQGQLFELKATHQRLMTRMFREHHRRVELLDELIQGQQTRDANLQRMIDHVLRDDDSDWWKKGEAPP